MKCKRRKVLEAKDGVGSPRYAPDIDVLSNTEAMLDPRSEELADACKDVITPDDFELLKTTEWEYALSVATSMLIENGVEDHEAFLKEKGFLE
jgi:hypothetical protein